MKKRLLSLLLCLVMVAGLLPAVAQAEGTDHNARFGSVDGMELYTNSSTDGVSDGPTEETTFTLEQATKITAIWTYHWNVGDDVDLSQQTIKLQNTATNTEIYAGAVCPDSGSGRENVNWYVFPDTVLPAGTYQVIDSHNESWSYVPSNNNKGMCTVKGYTGTFYEFNTPEAITQNGVTATVTFDKTSPQDASTSVTATVTLTGTSAAAGTHTVNLASTKASLNDTAQTATVTAGADLATTPVTKTFTFTMPTETVDDLTLTHTFDATVSEATVTDLTIEDAICPINGEAPVTEIAETEEYTGAIAWTGSPTSFAPGTDYTAIITLTAKEGYTFTGLSSNAFTIPGAKSVTSSANSGTITAVFQSPPEGYITDGNGCAAYRIFQYSGNGVNYGQFDILNTYQGVWMGTTYSNYGYGTRYRYGDGAPVDVSAVGQPVDMGDGITLTVQPVFSIDGKFINVAYTLKNTGSTDATVSVGSHADIQIGDDDSAPITKFDDGRGFRMVNRYNSNLQFNFFGKGTIGVTDVDTFWFGNYSDRRDDVFTQVEADSYSGDSGMAYSWVNRVIPAGETRVFRTTMGTSDAASGTNVPIGVNFDTQGGSEVAPIAVSSAGSTISAPAAPTRSGYQFDGWYTEPECVTRFDFSTPITATITLYAKWTQNADTTYTITFDTNGGTCGTSTMTTGADGKLASLPTPTRSGSYRFVGWYTAASGGTKVTTSTVFTANTTVYAHWTYTGGGGGGYTPPTYPPIVEQPKEGGSVSVSPSNPKQRDTVIITPKPDEGYEVDTITVTDRNGNPVTVTAELDGTYSFIQPNSKVKIEVTYKLTETPWRNPFTDISMGDWYYDAVLWAAENGITNGTSATTFSPNASCIRAQMATFLWNAAGKPEPESATSPFIDVTDPGAYYYKAVLWAKENGIAFGVGDHIFAPDAPCTRSQMTAFLFRFADGNKVSIANPFTDVKEGVWYYDSVMWAVFEGVTTGTSATTFAPESVCDRAQMVTFLYRLLGK